MSSLKSLKRLFFLILLAVFAVYSFVYTQQIIKPNMLAVAEARVRSMITKTVNSCVSEQFQTGGEISELLIVRTDQEGNITYVEPDTQAMNRLASSLLSDILEKYRADGPVILAIPAGSVLGSVIFSQMGPSVNLKIMPITTTRANIVTEFESMGINQTKYKVYLSMESEARVLAPFSANEVSVQNTVLIAEAVIVGRVPDSYINVPPGSAMDATNFFQE